MLTIITVTALLGAVFPAPSVTVSDVDEIAVLADPGQRLVGTRPPESLSRRRCR